MKKLFLSFLIIINMFQSSYAMDRELIVHEGVRFGLPTVRGVLVGLGFASFVPIHYKFDVNFSALKKYRDYLDTKLPVNVEDINKKDRKERVPLLCASRYGYLAGVNLLLENKADPNMKAGHEDETPLICAVSHPIYNPDLATIRALFMHGADINVKGGWRKSTPLMYAVSAIEPRKPDLEVINSLLEYKADPNVTDKNGDTPLLRAVSEKNQDFRVVNLLLRYKADPNVTDEYGRTPLLIAVSRKNSNLDVINSLLENKADPSVAEKLGRTPLLIVVSRKNSNLAVINSLLENKADPNVTNKHDNIPLIVAVSRKNPDFRVVNLLLEYKADPNVTDKYSRIPLIEAVSQENSNLDVINLLLENKADSNIKSRYDQTPLSIAVSQENPDFRVINLLLENKGNLSTIARHHEFAYLSIFDMVFCRKEPLFKVTEVFIAYILKLAQQNDFSIFDRKWRNKNNEIVFFGALDIHDKSVFDYAVQHKNRQAIVNLLDLIRIKKPPYKDLGNACINSIIKNFDKIDLENPDQAEKLKSVFYTLTAPYRTQDLGIEN